MAILGLLLVFLGSARLNVHPIVYIFYNSIHMNQELQKIIKSELSQLKLNVLYEINHQIQDQCTRLRSVPKDDYLMNTPGQLQSPQPKNQNRSSSKKKLSLTLAQSKKQPFFKELSYEKLINQSIFYSQSNPMFQIKERTEESQIYSNKIHTYKKVIWQELMSQNSERQPEIKDRNERARRINKLINLS